MKLIRSVVVFDTADLHAESAFWAGVLEGHVFEDDRFHCVIDAEGHWRIGVQLAPDRVPVAWPEGSSPLVHLDLHVDDAHAAHEQVMALGARLLQADDLDSAEGHQVYADPAGHPFCLGWGHPTEQQLADVVRESFPSDAPVVDQRDQQPDAPP